ncbi:MAG TPA: type II toxin-antitoxin system RelE/ParE family toxin [Candidatus Acidoferrales bacterium]|nr:type II toxin-antitoxin system RelE/ParE family toxin [Candidatus Acidoferrales bacterium]
MHSTSRATRGKTRRCQAAAGIWWRGNPGDRRRPVGDTYRAVYTVRLAGRIYVLHVFQKKSKAGIKTPKSEIELIKSRLKRAEEEHSRWLTARKE